MLIANRGEIALRVIRACREMGIATVAVYSDADRGALHVLHADEAYRLGPAPTVESYLRGDLILDVARRTGADAVHPGYGFLSENADFAEACAKAGVTFIGPPASAMRMLGSKTRARRAADAAGMPRVPGSVTGLADVAEALRVAAGIGYPVMLKAAAGGGGKGMRAVTRAEDLGAAFTAASSEAERSFGSGEVYLEKLIERPRHIEFQVLGDRHGNVIHLGERECSLQRRHQKVLEESPSVVVDAETRQRVGKQVVDALKAIGYSSAGTMEFLREESGNLYFIEMNARIQVEHPVTEMVTGVDLVKSQIRVAAGERLEKVLPPIEFRGHAIECRINAEDPDTFTPSAGKVTAFRVPGGPGIRVDTACYADAVIPPYYDSLIAKLISHGHDRAEAIVRMQRALDGFVVEGVKTTIPLHKRILADPNFLAGKFDTHFLERMTAVETK